VLVLLTIPKAFRGQIGVIQRNTIESWTHPQLRPETLLLGNDAAAPAISSTT